MISGIRFKAIFLNVTARFAQAGALALSSFLLTILYLYGKNVPMYNKVTVIVISTLILVGVGSIEMLIMTSAKYYRNEGGMKNAIL